MHRPFSLKKRRRHWYTQQAGGVFLPYDTTFTAYFRIQ